MLVMRLKNESNSKLLMGLPRPVERRRIGTCKGFGLLGWLLMIPVAIIVLLVLVIGVHEARKAYWDSKVKEMCAKDGGILILERIIISREQATALRKGGDFFGLTTEAHASPTEPGFLRVHQTTLREGNPRVLRYEQQVVRRSDNRIVGSVIIYGRGGGDVPSFAHPSSYTCPDQLSIYKALQSVFQIKEDVQ